MLGDPTPRAAREAFVCPWLTLQPGPRLPERPETSRNVPFEYVRAVPFLSGTLLRQQAGHQLVRVGGCAVRVIALDHH